MKSGVGVRPHDPERLPHGAPGFEVGRIGADPRVHDGVDPPSSGERLWFPLDRDGMDEKTLAGAAADRRCRPPLLGGRLLYRGLGSHRVVAGLGGR